MEKEYRHPLEASQLLSNDLFGFVLGCKENLESVSVRPGLSLRGNWRKSGARLHTELPTSQLSSLLVIHDSKCTMTILEVRHSFKFHVCMISQTRAVIPPIASSIIYQHRTNKLALFRLLGRCLTGKCLISWSSLCCG